MPPAEMACVNTFVELAVPRNWPPQTSPSAPEVNVTVAPSTVWTVAGVPAGEELPPDSPRVAVLLAISGPTTAAGELWIWNVAPEATKVPFV